MSIQQNRNDGLWRWFCAQCEPRYENWGPWGRPTPEHVEGMRAAELRHLWDWHTPQILKDAWGSQTMGDVRSAVEGSHPNCCAKCDDTGHVCENHPGRPWSGLSDAAGACGCGAGVPCPACCDPVPRDGAATIGDAFTPRHLRG